MILSPEQVAEIAKDKQRIGHSEIASETRMALAAYHGGEELKLYLRPMSEKEDPNKYNWRQSVAVEGYDNYPKEVLHHYKEGVFRTKRPERETSSEEFNVFLEYEYADWFMDKVIPMSALLPEFFVGYTKPLSPTQPETRADEIDMGLNPYPVLVFPQHVKCFSMNHSGNLEWLALSIDNKVIRIYDERHCYTVDGESMVVEEHGFSRIPFDRFAYYENYTMAAPSHMPCGRALLYDVVQKSVAGLNYRSMLDEASYYHLSLKLIMPEGTAESTEERGVGNTQIIHESLPPEGGPGTRYLETPSMEIQTLERIVYERTPRSIYRTARLRFNEQVNSESGLAKMVDLMPELALLKDLAAYWRKIDERILTMLAENAPTVSDKSIKIEYPVTFNTRTFEDVVRVDGLYADTSAKAKFPTSKTASLLMAQDEIYQRLPDVTDDEWETIYGELKEESEKETIPPNELRATVGGVQSWTDTVASYRSNKIQYTDLISIGLDFFGFDEATLKARYPEGQTAPQENDFSNIAIPKPKREPMVMEESAMTEELPMM